MTGMNAQTPSRETAEGSDSAASQARVSFAEIDGSCSVPVLLLFTTALLWLLIGLVLALVSSIKLHAAGFLSQSAWLTYGRVYPASLNAIVYGFASQAALGTSLWMLARLGGNKLFGPGLITVGALFWNLGVALGLIGILTGDSTGYEWLEIPGYASPILFFSFVIIGICAILTFHSRRERRLYVSQWYLLAALLWFPWVYSTAQLLLIYFPVRGAVQAIINGWFAHALFGLWLTPVGLAAIFYFIPKILKRPLHSQYLAIFSFWTLALFGGWGDLQAGVPVPKWASSVSITAGVMMLIPLLAVAINWHLTMANDCAKVLAHPVLRFVVFGAACYLLGSALGIAGSLRTIGRVTHLTLFTNGVTSLLLLGFVATVLAGAIYYIIPCLTRLEWPSERLITFHFWSNVAGVILCALPLIIGGVIQGLALNDPKVAFLEAARSTLPFIGMSTLGQLLLLAGNLALLVNLIKLLVLCCRFFCSDVRRATGIKSAAVGANV
jgi:cytochrome c oxidase cbb3-type subunit 1